MKTIVYRCDELNQSREHFEEATPLEASLEVVGDEDTVFYTRENHKGLQKR